jgi:uncharacterized membrane protein
MSEQGTSPESPPPAAEPKEGASENRGLMIVLAYLWILFLIPLLLEKKDREVQWHAKNGMVLTVLEFLIQIMLNLIMATGVGCVFAIFVPFVFLGFALIRLVAIVKGLNGERFVVPGISQYADRF